MADEATSGPAPHRSATRYAVKAALIYLVVFSIWIVASDRVIDTLTSGWLEDAIATWKGLFAVAASGVGVFLLVRRFGRKSEAAEAEIRGSEAALRRSEERYRSLVERVPGVVYLNAVDAADPTLTTCVYIGPQLVDLLGYEPATWIDDPELWLRIVHPDDRDAVRERNDAADATGEFGMEYRVVHRDGSVVWIHDEAVRIDDDGRPLYWQGVMLDITAQRMADAAVHGLAESLRGIFAASPLPIAVLNREGTIRHWNPAAERLFGWTENEVVGRSMPQIPEDGRDRFAELFGRATAGETITGVDAGRVTRGGDPLTISLSLAPLRGQDGVVDGVVTIAEDVTERRELARRQQHLAATLEERAEQLAQLAQERQQMLRRIVRAQEEERERVALEVHDGLGQMLTSISLFASDLEDEVPQIARARATRVNDLVRRAIADSRQLVWSLRPPELERLGLIPALRRLAEDTARGELTVDLHDGIGDLRLGAETEAVVYRIVQEAVHNAQKHAEASAISILLGRNDGIVSTIVEDNGRGFEPSALPTGRGLGLIGMRERAELVDGHVVVESSVGTGTRVRLEVPIGSDRSDRNERHA